MGVARNRRGPAGIGTRSAAAVVAAAIALLAAPGAARAATTCELGTSGGVLDVTMTASGDTAVLGVTSGGTEILVTGSSGGVACTVPGGVDKPRTTNTSAISVHNSSGLTNNDVTIAEAPRFGPGAPGDMTEGVGGAQEIEIFVNLNDGAGSELRVETELASSNQFGSVVRFGSGGINPNDGEPSPDVDIFPSSVPELRGAAIDAPGSILADGGRGTGGPLTMGITLSGGQGNDNLVGGSGPDAIQGGAGSDRLLGNEGSDLLDGGQGANAELSGGGGEDRLVPGALGDPVSGGDAVDELDHSIHLTSGITFDLEGSDIEYVTGTNFGDVLRGDGLPNRLVGLQGDDVIEGRGGPDALFGGPGGDSLEARDGGPDTADCGADTDTATADALGIDTLTDCENVLFPPPPTTPGTPPTPPGAEPPATPPLAALPAVSSLRLAPAAFAAFDRGPSVRNAARRPRGTLVSFTANLAASVTYRVALARPGRRVGRRCVAPTRANSRNRRCTRFALMLGSFARAARAGANRFRFTGRIGGRKLAPGAYQLRATPRAGGRSGATARTRFRIVP
jgi:Ca2+-binding RTX toxin-like protein